MFDSIAAALSDLILPKFSERWRRFQFILGVVWAVSEPNIPRTLIHEVENSVKIII